MSTSLTAITYGITEDGIQYQVYGEILSITENSITVTRNIIYDGNVTPSLTISWNENINGISYSGTLRLTGSNYNSISSMNFNPENSACSK